MTTKITCDCCGAKGKNKEMKELLLSLCDSCGNPIKVIVCRMCTAYNNISYTNHPITWIPKALSSKGITPCDSCLDVYKKIPSFVALELYLHICEHPRVSIQDLCTRFCHESIPKKIRYETIEIIEQLLFLEYNYIISVIKEDFTKKYMKI